MTLATLTKEDFTVELIEKEIFTVNLITADIIRRKIYIDELEDVSVQNQKDGQILQYENELLKNKDFTSVLNENIVIDEIPEKITNKKFKTTNKFKEIAVYLNGIREEKTIIDDNHFELLDDAIETDNVSVDYIKK